MGTMTTEPGVSRQAASTEGGHVVLCGLGRIGCGILDLLRRLGERVTVITLSSLADARHPAPDEDLRILKGDARDEGLLAQGGLARAKALIAATDDDLVNVIIALHARQVAPTVPVVVRLFDQDLASHLRASLGIRQGYSASALAAPAFVAAALRDTVLSTFEAGGDSWVMEKLTVAADAPWLGRSLGEMASLGCVVVAHERCGQFFSEPHANEVVAAGDGLITLTRVASGPRRPRVLRSLTTLLRGLREWWICTPRGLRFSLCVLLALVGVSVGVFHVALGLSPVDAYYFVITTLTTTGFGDINLQTARPLVKLYGTLVMISGGALFAVIFSMLTDLLLRTRFGDLLARGVVRQRDHVIVAGLGHTGFRVLRELSRLGENAVAIESSETADFLGPARSPAAEARAPAQRRSVEMVAQDIEQAVLELEVRVVARDERVALEKSGVFVPRRQGQIRALANLRQTVEGELVDQSPQPNGQWDELIQVLAMYGDHDQALHLQPAQHGQKVEYALKMSSAADVVVVLA